MTGPHGLIGGTLPGAARTGAVVDLSSGELLWSRRSWIPLSFSPNVELVAAVRQEGGLDASWSLLDAATGELVRVSEIGGRPVGFVAGGERNLQPFRPRRVLVETSPQEG